MTANEDAFDCRLCLVCQVPVVVSILGLDVCRACSLFFKRAQFTGVQYTCRLGSGKCSVASDGKFVCRQCRYNRCLAVGMTFEGQTRVRRQLSVSLLQRVGKEFRVFNERRRLKELEIMRLCGVRMYHPKEELYHISVQASSEIYTIAIIEAWSFFEHAFPTLKQLERMEHETIFKNYMAKINLISGYNCGRKLWKDSCTKMMVSAITCYDAENPFNFAVPGYESNNESFKSSLRADIGDHVAMFLPILDRVRLTDTECYALAALTMADQDLELSLKANCLLDDIRREILDNLHAHYQNEMALNQYSIRLGNLMTLNHAIQECTSIFRVFFRFYFTIFDLHMADRAMAECMMGS